MPDKETFIKQQSARLELARIKLGRVRQMTDEESQKTRYAVRRRLEELETTRRVLRTQLDRLRSGSDDSWKLLRSHFKRSTARLRDEVEALVQRAEP
jgi:hypothetical protein